jgi:hypothetical protein
VTDNLTRLLWTQDANTPGPAACTPGTAMQWQEALDFIACLNANAYLGRRDWRLPNRKELRSLVDYSAVGPPLPPGHPFANVQADLYWTSTTAAYTPSSAWNVDMVNGNQDLDVKDCACYRVWPVLGGITPVPALTTWGMAALVVIICAISLRALRKVGKRLRPEPS